MIVELPLSDEENFFLSFFKLKVRKQVWYDNIDFSHDLIYRGRQTEHEFSIFPVVYTSFVA